MIEPEARLARRPPRARDVVRIRDPAEADRVLSADYVECRHDPVDPEGHFSMELARLRVGSVAAGLLSYRSSVRLRTARARDYHVNVTLRGRATATAGGTRTAVATRGEGVVFLPGESAETHFVGGTAQLCLLVPADRLESSLEELIGQRPRDRIRFELRLERQSPLAHLLTPAVELLIGELRRPTALRDLPALGRHIEALLLDGLLLAHPHNFSDRLHARPGGQRGSLRAAIDRLHEQPELGWTTTSLAQVVHASPRALQDAFKREVGLPPMAYLRELRLHRAHRVLFQAVPGSTTVQAVAAGLGIVHLGRFAAAYRKKYGEQPSATLAHDPDRPRRP